MNNLRPIVVIAVTICLGSATLANPVTREGFLEQLKQTHPLFERERLTARIQQEERASFRGAEDWNVQSSIYAIHEEPSFAFAAPEKTDAISFAGGVNRKFWSTGGVLSATFSSAYASLDIDPFLGIPDSYFENQVAVTYSHPLLRNSGGSLDRLQYDLKQFDIDVSEIVAIENEEDFLAASATKFLNWVFVTEQERIITERVGLSEEELSRTREKRDANLIDEVDVIRAEDAVRIARQNLLLVQSQRAALQSEMAVLLADSNYYTATPEYDLYGMELIEDLNVAIARLKEESRLLQTIRIRIDQLSAARSGYAEQGKADLSLVAQVGLKNAETAFGRSLKMDKPDARLGLQLGFPLGNRTARAKVSQTDLQIMQLEKQLEELHLELSSAVAGVLTRMANLEGVLELNRDQIESARRKTVEELKLYDQGRGELTFVIQSRDSEQSAKLTYAANALTYQVLRLQYQALMDRLHQ